MFAAESVPPSVRALCSREAINGSAGSGISRGREKGCISRDSRYRVFSAMTKETARDEQKKVKSVHSAREDRRRQ